MNCTKCGRDIAETAVFCDKCLEAMKDYPVKPGTPIQLPHRRPTSPPKNHQRKKAIPPEEMVVQQRRLIKHQRIALACLCLLLALLIGLVFYLLEERNEEDALSAAHGQIVSRETFVEGMFHVKHFEPTDGGS